MCDKGEPCSTRTRRHHLFGGGPALSFMGLVNSGSLCQEIWVWDKGFNFLSHTFIFPPYFKWFPFNKQRLTLIRQYLVRFTKAPFVCIFWRFLWTLAMLCLKDFLVFCLIVILLLLLAFVSQLPSRCFRGAIRKE